MGKGAQGKHSGTGAMTPESIADGRLGENQVLSNRDKVQDHTDERGQDTRAVQNEQRQDNARNQQKPPPDGGGHASGMSAPMSTESGRTSGLERRQGEAGGLADPAPRDPDEDR